MEIKTHNIKDMKIFIILKILEMEFKLRWISLLEIKKVNGDSLI